jgi:hypothetical protein
MDVIDLEDVNLISYSESKIKSILIQYSKEINFLDWKRDWERLFSLRFMGVSKAYTNGSKDIHYENNFIFQVV